MYEPFFGIQRRPFSATPDSGCFFACESAQAALDELIVCVERGQGIGLLVAPAGMGKTLLCQRLVAEVSGQFEPVYLGSSTFPTRRSLLQAILFEMGDEYSRKDESELRLDLRSRLMSLRPEKEALVLIVDEAHLFGDELLEEIRTLSDVAHDGSSLVRIILSGQPELEERLTSRTFDALNQRISNQVYLESLTLTESRNYLDHRLEWAGATLDSVFKSESVDVISRASDGVARCLNQLADHCLLLAFASDEQPVERKTVLDALEDLKQLPLHWNDVSTGESVVGWQDDEEEEEDAQMPETDTGQVEQVADVELTDAPPHVSIEAGEQPTGELASESFSEDEPATDEPTGPVQVAVIEFGGPVAEPEPSDVDASVSEETASEVVDDTVEGEADLSSDADEGVPGLCFEITSTGCALSFESRAETDAADATPLPVSEADDPVSEPATHVVEFFGEAESSAADNTVLSEPTVAQVDLSEGDDVSIVRSPETSSVIAGTDATTAAAALNDENAAAESVSAPDAETAAAPVRMSAASVFASTDGDFEEEVVIDHYSAIAEPQSTGIIWNLVGRDASRPASGDPSVIPAAEASEVAAEASLEFGPSDAEVVAVEADGEPVQTGDSIAHDVQYSAEITPELSVEAVDESSDAGLFADAAESEANADDCKLHEILSTGEFVSDVPGVLSARPDDRIDAIVPLLDEISNGVQSVGQADVPERSLLDIEAELVQAVEYGQPEIEDEIGAAILDMCLDAQADIRDVRTHDEEDSDADAAIDYDGLTIGELSEQDGFSFDEGQFDIVEPEEDSASSYRFDAAMIDEREESGTPQPQESGSRSRPFGRLFSELRRRQRQAG